METIHKFLGQWSSSPKWEAARSRIYHAQDAASVSETWLIGKAEGAQNFAMRYYQIGPGGNSLKEQHPYDHGILILHGEGLVQLGEDTHPISQGDVVYIPPDLEHQLINNGPNPFGFLCVIPAKREKQGKIVWAEEHINFE